MNRKQSILFGNSPYTLWKQFIALAFFAIYLSANSIPLFHLLSDEDIHHVEEECHEEIEQDPCHRLVIHHEQVEGCEHEIHVSEALEKCELCDVILGQEAVYVLPQVEETDISFSLNQRDANRIQFESKKIYYKQLRGPPSFIS